jgi:dCTP deaminase
MILTDREIDLAIGKGQIVVEPAPSMGAISSSSLDLRLDDRARRFKPVAKHGLAIDPASADYSYHEIARGLLEDVSIKPRHILDPRELLLAWTIEKVTLPVSARLAARVEGKSSLARLGLGVHITAPTIHAGFSGQIQLEMVNHGPSPIVLTPGMSICQLIIEMTFGTPAKGYEGRFAGQTA